LTIKTVAVLGRASPAEVFQEWRSQDVLILVEKAPYPFDRVRGLSNVGAEIPQQKRCICKAGNWTRKQGRPTLRLFYHAQQSGLGEYIGLIVVFANTRHGLPLSKRAIKPRSRFPRTRNLCDITVNGHFRGLVGDIF